MTGTGPSGQQMPVWVEESKADTRVSELHKATDIDSKVDPGSTEVLRERKSPTPSAIANDVGRPISVDIQSRALWTGFQQRPNMDIDRNPAVGVRPSWQILHKL